LPPSLRTLDALHLATAMEIGDDLEGMVAYDDRLIEAARSASIKVLRPR
jgi:predicted nucleic acid-binding protein